MRPLQTGDPEQIGDYTVVGRLGCGAMGVVYLGRSPGGRSLAVKVARAELADDPAFRDRFRQEVATARAVGGFWTAAVVDADPDAPRPWLAVEYVPGPTLQDAVTAHGPLPEPALRRLVAGLAEALVAIHGAGLVHRDLKPSNVLLAADGPRVIDFGIAKALEGTALTATGMLVGTPGFLSPEQVEGRDVTSASDVFALGSVLVYAATGQGPFGVGDAAAMMYRAVHTRPELAGVPSGLCALATRCLNARPELRPTPADLLAEVGTCESTEWLPEPIRAVSPRWHGQLTQVAAPGLSPTRRYTVLSAVPTPPTEQAPGGRPHAVADLGPHSSPHPSPHPRSHPTGNRAVFRTSRRSALLWGGLTATGALICSGISREASVAGNRGGAFLFFVAFVLLSASAARFLWNLLRPPHRVEVSGAGLTVGRGSRHRYLPWSQLARVRVVEDRRRPWLVVWLSNPEAPDAAAALGARYPNEHGGYRVFPVGHEHRKRTRQREVRELRAALGWYGPNAYDASP